MKSGIISMQIAIDSISIAAEFVGVSFGKILSQRRDKRSYHQ
jgi:hypothetical protein